MRKQEVLLRQFSDEHSHKDFERAIWIEPWGIRDPGSQTTIFRIKINVQNLGMYTPRFIPLVLIIFWIIVFVWEFIRLC